MLKVLGVTVLALATIFESEVLSLAVLTCFSIAAGLKVFELWTMAG